MKGTGYRHRGRLSAEPEVTCSAGYPHTVHDHKEHENQGGVPGKKWHEPDRREPAHSLGKEKGLPGAGG